MGNEPLGKKTLGKRTTEDETMGKDATIGMEARADATPLGPEDARWLGEYSHVHMNVFGTPLRVMDHGEGTRVWDVDGKSYLDFLGGIAVNSLGYAHPRWVAAVAEQAAKVAHTSNYFATEPQIR